ncbi:unnamed protein product [Angiostrongylus costaricensis]|uniref:Major sperm protein n=1 Tax=Angiostrongylus costaricensis TaxID=334426 RepID=A0A0R3PSD5_ANGCS|nr:unnamed protein product [Angiostrongylus costaricensis]
MCVRKKTQRSAKENLKLGSPASTARSQQEKEKQEKNQEGAKTAMKKAKEINNDENMLAKPLAKDFLQLAMVSPLVIIMIIGSPKQGQRLNGAFVGVFKGSVGPESVEEKAKRPMEKVRSSRDPEYKTLELDISEWESVKIMKRSEINPEDFVKKDCKVDGKFYLNSFSRSIDVHL